MEGRTKKAAAPPRGPAGAAGDAAPLESGADILHHAPMSSTAALTPLLLAMPPKSGGPSVFGPDGDLYYAIFVGVVLVGLLVGGFVFYRRGEGQKRP